MATVTETVLLDVREKGATRTAASLAKVEKRVSGIQNVMKATSLAAVAAIAATALVIRAATRAMNVMVGLAGIQEVAQAKLKAAVRGNTDALIQQASALQDLTGVGDEVIINAQAMLGTFQLNAAQVAVLTPRILDMAASLQQAGKAEVDLQAIAIAMGKAVTIGASALTRYGVVLTDAQRKQLELATGMERINLIAEILDANFAGIAETVGDTFTGGMNKLNSAWGDFLETLGFFITKSPAVQTAIAAITRQIQTLTANLRVDPTGGVDPYEEMRAMMGAMGMPSSMMPSRESFEAARDYVPDIPNIIVPGPTGGGGAGRPRVEVIPYDELAISTGREILRREAFINAMDGVGFGDLAWSVQEEIRVRKGMIATIEEISYDVLAPLTGRQLERQRAFINVTSGRGFADLTPEEQEAIREAKGKGKGRPWYETKGAQYGMIAARGVKTGDYGGAMGSALTLALTPALGPFAPLVGELAGGILGKLFGGRKRPEPIMEPTPVKVMNFQDMLSVLLNITKGQLVEIASTGIDRLAGRSRMKEQMVGI